MSISANTVRTSSRFDAMAFITSANISSSKRSLSGVRSIRSETSATSSIRCFASMYSLPGIMAASP